MSDDPIREHVAVEFCQPRFPRKRFHAEIEWTLINELSTSGRVGETLVASHVATILAIMSFNITGNSERLIEAYLSPWDL